MAQNVQQMLAARQLARQYAIEMTRECQENGCPPESVTAEKIIERMRDEGLVTDGFNWELLLNTLLVLLRQLTRFFGPAPVMASESPPAEKGAAKKS